MRNILSITAVALLLGIASGTDYCQTSCGSTKNIGCNNTGAWGSACPSDKALVDFTTSDQNAIVAKHNEYRNFIAGGGDSKLSPACRMATMQWSDELAYLASLNVKSCQMSHDGCHNTDDFKWSGQNLAWIGYFNPLNATANAISSVTMWYNEVSNTQQSQIDAYPSNYNGATIGHFTVMVADRNTRVGCAASTYSVSGQSYKAFLMACNYAATNVIGVKMYNSCTVGASKCTTGVNPSYKFLCSTKEVYDVNNLDY
ncbi:antigen 5 like allergen Cul n 1-like [Drosophila montana]|uniref:antigen 5 like allergen Cul n 1-like n=1 Tax=Drosophila montana TaxID=40370 RepID=UPI00313A9BB3